ncbi:MAG: TetR/AcrR family transcriptional regulator [Victivallales bacterium]|nr:TetR/AcrR family transcriptional regulator [Victivallales bacterium]
MSDTKEKILTTALQLFAQNGYEAVSVSTIAGVLGMTKGALYRHYKNKREIFDRIVDRMVQIDIERAKKHEVPEVTFDQSPSAYRSATMDKIKSFTISQFQFWTKNEFGCDFRKMVTLEQYRNPEIADLYQKVFANGPVSYMEDLFREMMAQGVLKNSNPRLLALDFYAPFYLLISMSDAPFDGEKAIVLLTAHIENFIQKNSTNKQSQ